MSFHGYIGKGIGLASIASLCYGVVQLSEVLRKKLDIPMRVVDKEKNKNYVYLRKDLHLLHEDPNKGSLSQQTRHFIKDLFPAPLARLILLIDKRSVDLAEDYLSPWSVLRNAYSRNKEIRLKVVEQIASYKEWNDGQYHTLAQALDFQTHIGLARTYDVDMRLFLSPPKLPQIKSLQEIENALCSLLSNLPQEDVEQCIRYFTSGALGMSDDQRISRGGWKYFDEHGLHFNHDIIAQEKIEAFCIEALVKHSLVKDQCECMVKLNVLQLLQQIRNLRFNNLNIQRNIMRIVGNICRHEKLHKEISRSGWVTILAESCKATDASLRMQASRALANLDRETMKEIFEDGVYLLYPRYRSRIKPEADIVFIHGLMGGAFYTWRQQDGSDCSDDKTDCWPEDWLPNDMPGCRVTCVEYDTELSEWMSMCPHEAEQRTISFRSRTILDKIRQAGIGDRPIVWVTHSMGGLIVKHMLMDAMENPKQYEKIVKNTKGIVFFSTPHFGSQLANYSRKVRRILFPSVEVMELSHDSPKLGVMNDNLCRLAKTAGLKVLSFGEMQTTNIGLGPHIKILIVPPESADPGVGKFVLADTNHLTICKPASRHSSIYQQTLRFIRTCFNRSQPPTTHRHTQHEDDDNTESDKSFTEGPVLW